MTAVRYEKKSFMVVLYFSIGFLFGNSMDSWITEMVTCVYLLFLPDLDFDLLELAPVVTTSSNINKSYTY